MLVDQVIVELDAFLAGDAAEDDDQGLPEDLAFGESAGEVVVDPVAGRSRLSGDRCGLFLRGSGRGAREEMKKQASVARRCRGMCGSG